MPWCDSCSAYHAPTALKAGVCPNCGGEVSEGTPHDHTEEERTVGQSAPWHFWIVVVALAAYLIWRAISGIIWLLN